MGRIEDAKDYAAGLLAEGVLTTDKQRAKVFNGPWTIGLVVRGTELDLLRNISANFSLALNKLGLAETSDYLSQIPLWIKQQLLCLLQKLSLLATALEPVRLKLHAPGPAVKPMLPPSIVLVATGHSLGALLAEAAMAQVVLNDQALLPRTLRGRVRFVCTTFESPGLPSQPFHDSDMWRQAKGDAYKSVLASIFTAYLSYPNPVNTFYQHIGQVVHVMADFEETASYALRCCAADGARMAAAGCLASLGAGAAAISGAAAPAVAGTAMGMTLAATGTLVSLATSLGMEVWESISLHSLRAMSSCLDEDSWDFKLGMARPMERWPVLQGCEVVQGTLTWVRRTVVPSFLPLLGEQSVGIAHLHSRKRLVLRRCETLPGYVPSASQ